MEEKPDERGPVMICATRIIKPPPTRIGQIGAGFTLPRTVPLKSLIAGAGGASLGILMGAFFGSFQAILMAAIICGFLGVVIVTWSPVKGETLIQWLGANLLGRVRQRKLDYDGETQALYIGIARLHRVALGHVRIKAGAVPVDPDQVDERGVVRTSKNRNESQTRTRVRDLPGFQPLYDTELPDEVKRQLGTGTGAVRRTVGANAPRPQPLPTPTPTGPATRRQPRPGQTPGWGPTPPGGSFGGGAGR